MKYFALITASIVSAMFPSAGLFMSPSTFIVNSTADSSDANIGNGVCETSTPGECTFRAAIEEANANSGVDTINFNIPGSGPYTISPSYSFDYIFDPVIIDGTTQPGFAGAPIIELEGSSAGADGYGIVIFAGSSKVRGLVINRFNLTGIDLDVNGGNVIQGNYIGTDITGTIDLGNGVNGISISQGSDNNKIGGTAPGMRNIISGNGEFGIIIVDSGSTGNVIKGNFIGTDVSGTVDLGNSSVGVIIGLGASENVVGGTEIGSRNLISGNDSAGVHIAETGSTGNIVQGNYIGTDVTGTLALGNFYEGVFIGTGASNNLIGGHKAGAGNLISGNNGNGVTIGDIGTTGNLVQGNYIGTDATGTLSLGNTADGVVILFATDNTVGGTTPKARNIISGNAGNGVSIYETASDNLVQGNYIGTDVTGDAPLSNSGNGVAIAGATANNIIGGTANGSRNVISSNGSYGVVLVDLGTTGNRVQGNYIGTNAGGNTSLGNGDAGIGIFDGAAYNLIGGTTAKARNIISNNGGNGVNICCGGVTGNKIQGNFIGTDVTGTLAMGNTGNGVVIVGDAANNTIGGTASGAGNIIAYNTSNGVLLTADTGTGNTISSNFIYSNAGLGIDLGDDGVTPNDPGDGDSGANNLQNFPELDSARISKVNNGPKQRVEVEGVLISTPNTRFTIEFFSNVACDSSSLFGEGEVLLGVITVKTDKHGRANFSVAFTTTLSDIKFITATATDPNGNTSEFSECEVVKQKY